MERPAQSAVIARSAVHGLLYLVLSALLPATTSAQHAPTTTFDQASPYVAAFTTCADGQPVTFLNALVVETDSTDEILAHERDHVRQLLLRNSCVHATDSLATESPDTLLMEEVEAFCVSLPYAERRGVPRGVRIGEHADRLYRQFGRRFPIWTIAAMFRQTCLDRSDSASSH